MNEAKFVEWFMRHVNKTWRVNRIENTTSNGFPDAYIEIPSFGSIPIEFKANQPYLRKEQYAWLTKRWKMNLPALIFLTKNTKIQIWDKRVEVSPLKDGKKVKITSSPNWSCEPEIIKIEQYICQTIRKYQMISRKPGYPFRSS